MILSSPVFIICFYCFDFQVKQIGLNLGSKVALKWTGAGLDASCHGIEFQNFSTERTMVTTNSSGEINWDSVRVHSFAE